MVYIGKILLVLDNMDSNMGNKNSIKSRILKRNPECFIAGCNFICPTWLPARVAPYIMLKQDLTVKTIRSIYTIFLEVVQNERVF